MRELKYGLLSIILLVATSVPAMGEMGQKRYSSGVSSGYFDNLEKYEHVVKDAAATGDYTQAMDASVLVQKSLNIAATDSIEVAKIVGFTTNEIAVKEAKGEPVPPELLLRKILILQEIEIAQNNAIINALSHIARDHHQEQNVSK